MKKIGILTFQFAHNYGAVLQAYSLKRKFTKMGYNVDIINYCPPGLAQEYSLNPFVYVKRKQFGKILALPRRLSQSSKFGMYQKNELELREQVKELNDNNCQEYEVIVVGSDQVWNDDIVPDVAQYFLKNLTKVIKVSYAASFGKKIVSKNVEKNIKNELNKYRLISVREGNTLELINKHGIQALHVLDPVFLTTKDEWREFYRGKNSFQLNKEYIIYIDLLNDTNLISKCEQLSNELNLPVYAIHPTAWKIQSKKFKQLYNVGPYEYLNLIDKANVVVTNSFHAVAFSYIFKKKVLYYMENELNNRITDLFSSIMIEEQRGIINFETINEDCIELQYKKTELFFEKFQEIINEVG